MSVVCGILLFAVSNVSAEQETKPPIEMSAVLEVEATSGDDFNGVNSSDIALATVEISLDAQINELVSGHILLLHEEDDTPLEIDEGYITLQKKDSPFGVMLGQMYVPFGLFETAMISDPLTLEIGETRESAIMLSFDNAFYASIYYFNGDTMQAGKEDKIDQYGANIGFKLETDSYSINVGYSTISSIADSENLTQAISDEGLTTPDAMTDIVSGSAIYAVLKYGMFTLIAEQVAADDKFDPADLTAGSSKEMKATNLELGVEFSNGIGVAIATQSTTSLAGYLPETRNMATARYELAKKTTLAIEYLRDEDYSVADGGTGEMSSMITLQLAIEL